jgi:hypothetical protein
MVDDDDNDVDDENDMGWVVEDAVENGSCDEEDEINQETNSNEAMDVDNDVDEEEEEEGDKEEDFLQNQNMEVSFPVQTASRSVWDIIAGEDPQKKQAKLKSCTACGKEGHAWPTCRRKNVEFMLLKIGAMQAPKKLDNPSPALLAVVEDAAPATKQKTRKREVRSSLAEVVEFEATAAHVESGSKKPKSDGGSMLACDICGEQPDGNWRMSGRKCVCGKFVHSRCWAGKRNGAVLCTACEPKMKR